MTRFNQWMLAAIFTICGAMVISLTSCSSDSDDDFPEIDTTQQANLFGTWYVRYDATGTIDGQSYKSVVDVYEFPEVLKKDGMGVWNRLFFAEEDDQKPFADLGGGSGATGVFTYTINSSGIVKLKLTNLDLATLDQSYYAPVERNMQLSSNRLLATGVSDTPISLALADDDLEEDIHNWHLLLHGGDDAHENGVVNLSKLTKDYVAQDGEILTGTLPPNISLKMAENASITLRDVTHKAKGDASNDWKKIAGIQTALYGTNTITLEGNNTLTGYKDAGIFVIPGSTIVIKGEGSLYAEGWAAAGIGCASWWRSGKIIIEGGNIKAVGDQGAAGIGTADSKPEGMREVYLEDISDCEGIYISGGTVEAIGGDFAAGIGSGYGGECEPITITFGVTKVTATAGFGGAYPIGRGRIQEGDYYSWCRSVVIGQTLIYSDGKELWTPGSPLLGFDCEVFTKKDDRDRETTTWVLTSK